MRTTRLALALALVFAAFVIAGCTSEPPVNPRLEKPVDPTASDVPVLTEISLGRAMERIEEAGLDLDLLKWTETSDLDPGTVVSQEPDAGATVPKGSSVTLVVAGAPGDVAVPDVVGMTLEDARRRLAEAALIPTVNSNSERDPAKVKVVEQYPPAGESVAVGSRIEIVTP